MTKKVRVHDGIIGSLILLSSGLAWYVDPRWVLLGVVVGAVMVSSTFTGFCPIHFTLGKLMKD